MSEENNQAMESALQTLNQLATSHSTPKNFKKTISDLIIELQSDEYSMSVNDLYTLNDFHKKGKLSLTYTNYYSGLVNYFQSSYIYKSTDKSKIGISFLHKEIKDIPNTQNAWVDVGSIISQDQIDYSSIEFYDDRQVALILLYLSLIHI